ncbi:MULTISPECIES: 3-hydroxyacyl-CoA dehydrogenase family protein [unclassified Gordonia (in: high G+C Gram-positive bacteria)]|uniref:3-hydroxyacyl-CoA dehydrogenase family protein n=1 Tax=unclassified Gordonia (in: high G+C Gram-positive bacteria) TaxID=2657482 RepID=UPI0020001D2D|nr:MULTISPECIES: 3-hydroxyacyl-CoA dehydrogenase family protein [unclassified Gordonia (in: high G+C Gram-positive bacteria)]UQE75684.1 3-hydroxyacyl-CoA dehydrogenase family protein [Gordonia sp. PP30]
MSGAERVTVIGAGAMGSQIAMLCALAGHETTLVDAAPEALDRATAALRGRTDAMVAKGRRGAADVDAAWARLRTAAEPDAGSDLVIEAIVEKLAAKRELFAGLDARCGPDTVFASNSSSFVPSSMASATHRADRFVNLHFFNPALVMTCVEVVRGPDTSDATAARAIAFVEGLARIPVVLEKEIPGFVANRLLNAVRDEALALYEGGYAGVEAIDTAARTALGYPMGPFELMDLTGVDIGYLTKQARYADSGDPADLPSRTVTALVEAGHLGRKTGRGFYFYDESGHRLGKAL